MKSRKELVDPICPSKQVRDLTVLTLSDDLMLVVAVDSDGGIGPKPGDVVKVSGVEAGRFAMRVPLMEILACGAVPVAAFDCLTVEMEPTGKTIISGVREELRSIGLSEHFPLSGSTEDNVPTRQTGIGVMVLGIVQSGDFRPGTSKKHDVVFCIGVPKSGPKDTVSLNDPSIATSAAVASVRLLDHVHDILPVGSKGILYEANEMAKSAELHFESSPSCTIDLERSAGPSTCFICSGPRRLRDEVAAITMLPVETIGTMEDIV